MITLVRIKETGKKNETTKDSEEYYKPLQRGLR